ncbi:MAG: LamG domain-containing protein, partial [Lentisphaeria bacterium]|nr:LamG domain-containing protein [Lentisphaeria bacterium]
INFTGEFSIAVWVRPYWWNANWAPVVYRSDATYGIRNNRSQPGQLHFRVKDAAVKRGTNLASNTILERNSWYHVAAVFKPGKFMRLYINGKLDSEVTDRVPKKLEADRSRFHLGGKGKDNYFAGLLSDLHFYDHALTPEEVLSLYRRENRFGTVIETSAKYPEDGKTACKISPNASVYESGAIKVVSGNSRFRIDSIYSYPASPVMEFNAFAAGPVPGEKSWKPAVKALNGSSAEVAAAGRLCSVRRTVKVLPDGRIRVTETITNRSKEDQGMVIFHRLTPEKKPDEWYLFGQENAASAGDSRLMSANPTLYVRTGSDAAALVAEDDIFRCTMTSHVASLEKQRKRFDFGCRIGIPAGKSHTLEFTIYPMHGTYFDFINLLRADWKVPVQTLNGPFGLVRTAAQRSEVYRKFAADKPAFKKEFERRNMRVITLNPWFNYWDGAIFPDRESFKKHMQQAMRTIREVNPEAKFLVSLESYVYCLSERDFNRPAKPGFSWTEVTPATRERVLNSPWRDSVRPSPDKLSLYPLTPVEGCKSNRLALNVYPERGNQFYKTRLEEFDFLLDEVGFDGVYQDMFGFSSPNYVRFDRWDGFSVSIKPDGTIGRKMCHLGPLTAPARADWLRKIISKGKIALTNFGAPTTRELQTIPYWNFCEAAGRGIGRQDLDSIPPDSSGCAMNQLSTPLGYGPHREEETNAVRLMARVRAYLRYGCLYIHTSFRNSFPETGPKSGAYGPINHMYPITPVELRRGWVKGKERIVSCVSYRTSWDRQEKPKALRFDAVGRDKSVGDAVKISGKPGAWEIEVKIDDWKEFLILE